MNTNFYTTIHKVNYGFKTVSKTMFLILLVALSSKLFAQSVPAAPTNVTASPSAICLGSSTSIKATSPGNTIRWYTEITSTTSIGSSASGANFSVSPSVATTYYAESYSSLGVASATRSAVSVIVNTIPEITSVPQDIMTSNTTGDCGAIVSYPSVTVIGIPAPSVIYSQATGSHFQVGTTTVLTTAVNVCGSSSLSFDVTVNDVEYPAAVTPPNISLTAPSGSTTVSNVDLGTPTVTDNCGEYTITNDAPSAFPGGNTVVTWTIADSHGHSVYVTQNVFVLVSNTAPQISDMSTSSSGNLMATGTSTTLTVNWNDEASGGPYTIDIDWMDNTSHSVQTGISGHSVNASHTYANSGIFEPSIKVTDGSGAIATTTFQYIVVYVTGNQFTTGGGNFMAPAGSLVSNQSLSGKINMGSNCKPKNGGGFQGNLEMNFQAGNINFKSASPTSWDYLSIGGCYLAAFRGTGTINGSGNYGILVVQSDKDRNPSNANNVRIKIWNKNAGNSVVFDTQPGDEDNALPTTHVTGAIQVHVQNDCQSRLDGSDVMIFTNGTFRTVIAPNPFTTDFKIDVSSLSESKISVEIFDVVGKMVQSIPEVSPNQTFTVQNELPVGVYFVRLTQDENSQVVKVVKDH